MRVLLVDDEPALRGSMRALLKTDASREVLEASNGQEAWQLLDAEDTPVDLCILDQQMPDMSGLEFLAKLRTDPRFKSLKVLFCSANSEREIVVSAAHLGIKSYLLKPFSAKDLLTKVQQALALPTLQS